MNKRKIINDPVYGFITIPFELVFDLMEHPIFQRLRRIKQLGLTHYVYPGALHTRFHHALGAMHLMIQAIKVLRDKGVEITEEEAKAVIIAILLHDIGHGPFSHTLEHTIIDIHHEDLSVFFMEKLNESFDGALDLAIKIFKKDYHKKFLYQLVSSQLDMDRMDYLNRDSFFTGVAEGVIGYDRIINMLSVVDNELVVEEKGIYSIEKFLLARRIMYWQVYLHRTVLGAEQMLIRALQRAKWLTQNGEKVFASESLAFFLKKDISKKDLLEEKEEVLKHYAELDDVDIVSGLKSWCNHNDKVLSYLSKGLIKRNLFQVEIKETPIKSDYELHIRHKLRNKLGGDISDEDLEYLVFTGSESNRTYSKGKQEIKVKFKDGRVKRISDFSDFEISPKSITKFYICYPKFLNLMD
ncbi:MAG: HD superfamily phosphohydrolase [Cognaticolwellia sp.]|jgi:HD superfamily phosphohydrolase